jgi:hypothetical protein
LKSLALYHRNMVCSAAPNKSAPEREGHILAQTAPALAILALPYGFRIYYHCAVFLREQKQ